MALLSNKILFSGVLLLLSVSVLAQEVPYNQKEYHDKSQFKKYNKRADIVAAWQIQNLKFGALVVRLQNNQRKVDAFRKIGQEEKAQQVIAETQYYNKLMINAYTKDFNFCKVYFMFANLSDSLLHGTRKGIFVDSTLKINGSITLNENFYILAEKDFVYNSSIGFVKEDTAKFVTEHGNKTIDVAVALKNKYGHQLKSPFPFYVKRSFLKSSSNYMQSINAEISPNVFKIVSFEISKDITPEKQGLYLSELSESLQRFYQRSQGFQVSDPTLKPFLY